MIIINSHVRAHVCNWREELRAIACASVEDEPSDVEISSEDDEPEKSSIGTHGEAIHVANDLLLYLSQNGEEEIAEIMGKVMTSLQSAKMQLNMEQTTISKYFKVS